MRPRERYLIEGPGAFGDAELLALVIGTGAGGRSALQIARDLLDAVGGAAGLAAADPRALATTRGVGRLRALRVHAACALARRGRSPAPPAHIQTPEAIWRFLAPRVAGAREESLYGFYLDRRGRLMSWRALTRGNDSFTIVDPRQVFRPAVAVGAHGVILAHNHPSGDPEPSEADRSCTRQVADAGEVLGVRLLDHLVLGREGYTSLAARGMLAPWSAAAQPPTTRAADSR